MPCIWRQFLFDRWVFWLGGWRCRRCVASHCWVEGRLEKYLCRRRTVGLGVILWSFGHIRCNGGKGIECIVCRRRQGKFWRSNLSVRSYPDSWKVWTHSGDTRWWGQWRPRKWWVLNRGSLAQKNMWSIRWCKRLEKQWDTVGRARSFQGWTGWMPRWNSASCVIRRWFRN